MGVRLFEIVSLQVNVFEVDFCNLNLTTYMQVLKAYQVAKSISRNILKNVSDVCLKPRNNNIDGELASYA